jgi:lysophospholipase L1-like esterase
MDFVLYGDSIVADLGQGRAFANSFKTHFGDVNAVALGVGGTNIEQLTWRITAGTERFQHPPKCIAVLIGTNNVRGDPTFSRTSRRVEELLRWLRAAYPSTKLVLMALLPTVYHDTSRANALYRNVASRLDVTFVGCGQQLNPRDKTAFRDGIHPAAAGHDAVLRCLRQAVSTHIT